MRMRIWLGILAFLGLVTAEDYDIIVVGGGEAGIAVALQASWLGSRVALIEETDYLGGMMGAAGVSNMDGNYWGFHRTGIYKNFTEKVKKYYASIGRGVDVCYWSHDVICFEPKVGESILRAMLTEAHVNVVTRSYPRAAFFIPGTRKLSKLLFSDGKVWSAKVFVDASEYGDLLHIANAPYRAGNRTYPNLIPEGCVQPFTYTAVVKLYDNLPDPLRFVREPPGFRFTDWNGTVQINGSEDIFKRPWSWEFFKQYRGMPDSSRPNRNDLTKTGLNVEAQDTRMNVSHLDRKSRFEIACEGKLRTLQLAYYIQKYIDGRYSISTEELYNTTYNIQHPCPNIPEDFRYFEQHMPVIPYIRESRRLLGLYTLTLEDIYRNDTRNAREFADAVAIGDYEEDLHGCMDLEEDLNETTFRHSTLRKAFEIPMDCLIHREVPNLMAAGKTISVSRIANGATRNQPVSMLTGQATGVIAALAARHNIAPASVGIHEIHTTLDKFQVAYKANP